MFGPKFQRRYALTDQGVFNTKRGTFWTVIVNLIVMGGIGILYFLMTMAGKYMSVKALSSVFDPDKYSGDDIIYNKKVLNSMSIRTIWRGFYSTNNYCMPSGPIRTDTHIEYWYGEDEKSAR